MADIRVFVAIELPGAVGRVFEAARQHLAGLDDRVRWVRPEGMHLTLKFLGDVDSGAVSGILEAMQNVAERRPPLMLHTGDLGGGPRLERARVIWLGIGGETEKLAGLQGEMEAAMEELGFERESRRYYPHATLGRARRKPVRLPDCKGVVQPVHFRVDRVVLFQSELRPDGAVYRPLGYGLLSGNV